MEDDEREEMESQMTTRTDQTMTATTMSMTMGSRPSAAALATRSLRAAERVRDQGNRDEYRGALSRHFAEFVTAPSRACPLRSS